MGGLAVAARLAARRHQVTVVDRRDVPGGKLHTWKRDGFAFDTGPSLFTLPAVYRDLFLKTGRPLEDEVDLQPVDPGFHYRFADGTSVTVPGVGVAQIANALQEAMGGTAGKDWRALMARAAQMWALTRERVLASPLQGPRSMASLARRPSDIATIAPHRTLAGMGKHYLDDPRLRTLLHRYATYTGSDPSRAPAALATVPYVEQSFGAWHIGGGLGELAGAVYNRAIRLGVDFRLGEAAEHITTSGGAISGVVLEGGSRLEADVVVSDVDARHLYRDLVPADVAQRSAGGQLSNLRRLDRSMSAFTMLLALRDRTPDAVHHTVLFPKQYDQEFADIFGTGGWASALPGRPSKAAPQPVRDPAIYLCNPDDDRMRPDAGHEAVFVMVNAPGHDPSGANGFDWSDSASAESYADHILALMASRGMDVRHRLLWRRVRTPADLAADHGDGDGAIYGSASHGPNATLLRPRNASPIPGLFLVGGSAHPGGGLPLVGLSAEIVSDLVGKA